MKSKKQDKITQYWVAHARYDFETAEALLRSGRYLYVTFMCQQSIEKLLKAIITTVSNDLPPRTHNLIRLSEVANIREKLNPDQLDFLATLTPFCIETRYADYIAKMTKLADKGLAKDYLAKTKEMFKCLKKMV